MKVTVFRSVVDPILTSLVCDTGTNGEREGGLVFSNAVGVQLIGDANSQPRKIRIKWGGPKG